MRRLDYWLPRLLLPLTFLALFVVPAYAQVGGAIDLKIDSDATHNGEPQPNLSWAFKDLVPGEDKLFNFNDIRPGDSGTEIVSLHVATNDAYACMDVTNLENDDNGLTDAEAPADTNGTAQGELGEKIKMFWWGDDGDGVLEQGERMLSDGIVTLEAFPLPHSLADSEVNGWSEIAGPIPGDTTKYIGIHWCVGDMHIAEDTLQMTCDGSTVGNEIQTDSATFDIAFRAVQSRNNPDFLCRNPSGGGFSDTESSTGNTFATDGFSPEPTSFTLNGDSSSYYPFFNNDGRFVAFTSIASNFVSNDTNNTSDVFVYDRSNGTFDRVSVSTDGVQDNTGAGTGSFQSTISNNGRFVVFHSDAETLVDGDTNSMTDVFLRDRQTGETTRVSVASDGTQGNNNSHSATISDDGRFVTFESLASNLVPDDTNVDVNGNGGFDVFVHDVQTGSTERVSIGPSSEQGIGAFSNPSISSDGRFVAFNSGLTNWNVSGNNVFVRDRTAQTTGLITPVNFSGSANPIINADGRYVAFSSLNPDDPNVPQVFVLDRLQGGVVIASVSSDGVQAQAVNGASLLSMSDDGRYVLFITRDPNLAPNPATGEFHMYVRDLVTGTTARVMSGVNGGSLSGDGKLIAYFNSDLSVGSRADIFIIDNPLFDLTPPPPPSENHAPSIPPFHSRQSTPGGQIELDEGSSITESTVIFDALLEDQDEDPVRLQVELRQFDEPFTGNEDGILTSDQVSAGSVASITRSGLLPGAYHWRARAVDDSGTKSEWMEFGGSEGFDFRVFETIVNLSPLQNVIPEVLCAPAKHLVFITHGWGDNALGWVKDMALSIQNYINAHVPNPGEWSVCTFDWSQDADKVNLDNFMFTGKAILVPPWDAFAAAGLDGTAAGAKLLKNNYESIHFLGHSAGSNVIQSAADIIRRNSPATKIHLTFLDAYDPNGIVSLYGVQPVRNPSSTVPGDWWAEQYVDKRGDPILAPTNILLPHAYNFDVTALDPAPQDQQQGEGFVQYAPRVHAWPHKWYQGSISSVTDTSSTDPMKAFGFKLSLESGASSLPLQFPNISPLNVCTFKKDTVVPCLTLNGFVQSRASYFASFNVQNNLAKQSQTGQLNFPNELTVNATPSSPVWFEIYATTTAETNILRFEYEFLTVLGSENVVTVFVDDKVVYKIDERITDTGPHIASEISIGELAPGEHRIGFRVDPFTDAKSTVRFSNIQLGLLTVGAVDVKSFLDDALENLSGIVTNNRDINKATDAVEKDLAKIIADKLWLDRNRLSWPKGASVLSKEVNVIRDIGDILNKAGQRKGNVIPATQAIYRDAQSEIVQSSALLAKLSFDKAKILKANKVSGQRSLDKAIARIQKMLDRALAKESKNPAQAVQLYGAAWFASEALLKANGTTLFRAFDFGVLYNAEDMRDLMD